MITERKKVRIVGTDKKYHEAPVFIVPKYDDIKKILINGQENWTDAEKEELATLGYVIDQETTIRVSHLMVLDLANPIDRAQYEIIIRDSQVAIDKKSVNPGAHRYYVEDKEEESKDVVSKAKRKFEAMEIVRTWSLDEMISNARVLGCFVRSLSNVQIEAWVYEQADSSPDRILTLTADKDLKYKVFINKLVDKNVWQISSGKYMCGSDLIGIDQSYAIAFLRDKSNKDLATQWAALVGEALKSKTPQPSNETIAG